jgi:hypothetical protein
MRRESGKTEDCLKEERAHHQSEPQAGRSPRYLPTSSHDLATSIFAEAFLCCFEDLDIYFGLF